MADQTMEYKIINQERMQEKVKETGGKITSLSHPRDPKLWEHALNAFAREGWTVVSSDIADDGGYLGFIILGRPI